MYSATNGDREHEQQERRDVVLPPRAALDDDEAEREPEAVAAQPACEARLRWRAAAPPRPPVADDEHVLRLHLVLGHDGVIVARSSTPATADQAAPVRSRDGLLGLVATSRRGRTPRCPIRSPPRRAHRARAAVGGAPPTRGTAARRRRERSFATSAASVRRSARAASAMLSLARAKPSLAPRAAVAGVDVGRGERLARPGERDHRARRAAERPHQLASPAHLRRRTSLRRRTARPSPPRPRARSAPAPRAASAAGGSRAAARRPRRRSRHPARRRPGRACRGRTAKPPSMSARLDEQVERAAHERVAARETGSVDRRLRRGLELDVVADVERHDQARELVIAVAPPRADPQDEIDLRRRERLHATGSAARAPRAPRTPSGCSASARARGSMPAAAHTRSTTARGAQPASASEFASVLRRWANPAETTARIAGQRSASSAHSARRRNATSDESTFGTGTKTERDTAWRPTGSSASAAEDARRAVGRLPRARRGSGRRPRAGRGSTRCARSAARRSSGGSAARRRCTGGSRRTRSATARARRGRARIASPQISSTFGCAVEHLGERRLEPAVDLDRDARARPAPARCSVSVPTPAPISSATSSARRSASRSITPSRLSSTQEVLPELAVRPQPVVGEPAQRPLARLAASDRQRERRVGALDDGARRARRDPSPRSPATKRSVSSTIAGRQGRPRCGTGARYGESVSTSSRSAGTRRAASCNGRRARVRHVAGEARPPAALDHLVEVVRQREAVQHDAPGEPAQHRRASPRPASRVWITSALPASSASSTCPSNARACASRGARSR